MQDAKSSHQESADTAVTPIKGLMIMAGSILAIIAAIATPVLGEALFAVLLYGKSVKKTFRTKI